jgi:formylglycine-generating enzyme required for sulfatase activity
LRQIYKGRSEKALAVSYFRQLRGVLSGGGVAAAAGAAAPAPGASPDRGPAVAVPGMPTASGAELESFRVAEAANSTDGWMRFLTQYAGGYLSGAARTRYDELDKKKVEQAVYALARKSDTEKTWEAFLALYPNSATVNEAERRKSELKNARESETNAFRLAETKNSDVAWERYLKEFPGGQLAILAEDRLETMRRIAKEKEDNSYGRSMRGATLEEYDRYLNEYPSGRYSDEISKKKLELAKRLEEERERKAELDAYTAAKTGDTIASWGGYLAKYAKALHTEEALRRTEQLKWVAFADVAVIPAGSFNMGSEQNKEEKPVHRVEVDGFLLMKAEVTNAQFAKFAQETNHRRPPDPAWAKGYATTHADLPVLGVAYDDAVAFCKWLAQKTGAVVRLPTEAEWEYAAVGGKDNLAYPWGFEKPKVKARYNGNTPPGAKTAAANAYAPNAFGLVNMSGNAAEWVHDYYSETFYRASPKRNPAGPPAGLERVLRGGSYKTGENEVRCASREKRKPAEPGEDAGFRALIEPPKK